MKRVGSSMRYKIFVLATMIEIYNNTTKIRIQQNNSDKSSGNIVADVKCTSNDAEQSNPDPKITLPGSKSCLSFFVSAATESLKGQFSYIEKHV